MSKNASSMLAGFMLFCVSHNRMTSCPICLDSAGNVKKSTCADGNCEQEETNPSNNINKPKG